MLTGMMKKDHNRLELRKYCDKRKTFTALFTKKGEVKGKLKRGESANKRVCLEDIRLVSNSKNNRCESILCDHVWVVDGEWTTHLESMMYIQYDAKVLSYIKYKNNKSILSWKLDEIDNVKILRLTTAQYHQLIKNGKRNLIAESYEMI